MNNKKISVSELKSKIKDKNTLKFLDCLKYNLKIENQEDYNDNLDDYVNDIMYKKYNNLQKMIDYVSKTNNIYIYYYLDEEVRNGGHKEIREVYFYAIKEYLKGEIVKRIDETLILK